MMKIETLFYFAPNETDLGIMPGFYELAKSKSHSDCCRAAGGILSDDWGDYQEQLDYSYHCTT